MRYLLLIAILIVPTQALAITGDSARFDFSAGQPTIVDDSSSTCNNQATIRYDFVSGQPAQVFDSSATCTAVGGATPATPSPIIWFDSDD